MSDTDNGPIEVGARYMFTEAHENDSVLVSDTFTVTNIRVATPNVDIDFPAVDVEYDANEATLQAEMVPLSDLRSRIRRGEIKRVNDEFDAGKRRKNVETGAREDTPSDTERLNDAFDTLSSSP